MPMLPTNNSMGNSLYSSVTSINGVLYASQQLPRSLYSSMGGLVPVTFYILSSHIVLVKWF